MYSQALYVITETVGIKLLSFTKIQFWKCNILRLYYIQFNNSALWMGNNVSTTLKLCKVHFHIVEYYQNWHFHENSIEQKKKIRITYCFIRLVRGQTLLALLLWVMSRRACCQLCICIIFVSSIIEVMLPKFVYKIVGRVCSVVVVMMMILTYFNE